MWFLKNNLYWECKIRFYNFSWGGKLQLLPNILELKKQPWKRYFKQLSRLFLNGASDRNWTNDLLTRNESLSVLSVFSAEFTKWLFQATYVDLSIFRIFHIFRIFRIFRTEDCQKTVKLHRVVLKERLSYDCQNKFKLLFWINISFLIISITLSINTYYCLFNYLCNQIFI